MESNLNYLRNAHENVRSAKSIIRDADMAEELTVLMSEPVVASADWQQESDQFPQQILQSVGKKWVFGAQT